jgi:hypothetical protein
MEVFYFTVKDVNGMSLLYQCYVSGISVGSQGFHMGCQQAVTETSVWDVIGITRMFALPQCDANDMSGSKVPINTAEIPLPCQ